MEQEDTLNIMEEILACGILNSSPHSKKAERPPFQPTTSDTGDDGWNTDIDISGLLVAIENCGILDTGEASIIQNKRSRGRPKKKVMKRTANRELVSCIRLSI
jgi:hypothetical protein